MLVRFYPLLIFPFKFSAIFLNFVISKNFQIYQCRIIIYKMANGVTRVIERCEDATKSEHLGITFSNLPESKNYNYQQDKDIFLNRSFRVPINADAGRRFPSHEEHKRSKM